MEALVELMHHLAILALTFSPALKWDDTNQRLERNQHDSDRAGPAGGR